MMIPFAAFSQTTDAVWIPRKDALGTLARVERLKADSVELYHTKLEVVDLKNMVSSQRISIENLNTHVLTLGAQITNYARQVSVLERGLRKQRNKTRLVTFGGVALSASLLYFLIK